MAEKHIYLVRHGQSEYNVAETMLPQDTPLTAHGLAQAEVCALRCASLQFETIFTSTYQRAKVTGEIIQKKTGKPLIASPLFLEYRYPDSVIGLPKKGGPSHLEMIGGIETRYPGGETFAEMHARAREALTFFQHREEGSMLLVSHGFFIQAMLTEMVFGDKGTFAEFEQLFHTFVASNTGITHCIFDDEKLPERKWRVITWNDDAHLGELA